MNAPDEKSIGQRLKKEREAHSWSQSMLAEKIGASVLNINRWENDRNFPQPYYREKLCQIFGKSTYELFSPIHKKSTIIKTDEYDFLYSVNDLLYDAFMDAERLAEKHVGGEKQKDRILHIDLEPEQYGKSAAHGIYDLVQTWPEGYDYTLARGEGRIDSGESFFVVWGQKHAMVFDKQFQQLRQELWGDQFEQTEHELLQQMIDAEIAIQPLLESEGTAPVIAPYNAGPDTCQVFLQGGIARVKYKDTKNLGKTTNSVLAEVAAGSNMFGRMYYRPKAQQAYELGLLEIGAQSQEQLDNRFAIARVIVGMGSVYLASYAMDKSINPYEHHMARTQLIALPYHLRSINSHYQRLSADFTQRKSQDVSKSSLS